MTRKVKIPGQNIRDTTPHLRAAGIGADKHSLATTAKDCILQDPNYKMVKQQGPVHRELEKQLPVHLREVYPKAVDMVHGIKQPIGYSAHESIVPPKTNALIQEQQDAKESKYHRKEFNQLGTGKSHHVNFPEKALEQDFRFGLQSHKDVDVKYIIHPPVQNEIQKEPEPVPVQTKVEPVKRNDGQFAREALNWIPEEELQSKYVNERLARFLQVNRSQVGKVHDPLKDTIKHISSDYTFGVAIKQDEHKIASLLNHSYKDTFKLGEKISHIEFSPDQLTSVKQLSAYGSPSILTKQVQEKKLSDTRTYINEVSAPALINPSPIRTYRKQLLDIVESKLHDIPTPVLSQIRKELDREKATMG